MKIVPEFVKALVAATAGLGVVAILALAGGALSERMLAVGGDNYGLNGMPGMTLGTIAGLILGGFVSGRLVKVLRSRVRKRWLLLIGPGLWIWLAVLGLAHFSAGATTEFHSAQLFLGLCTTLVSFAGTLAGARGRLE